MSWAAVFFMAFPRVSRVICCAFVGRAAPSRKAKILTLFRLSWARRISTFLDKARTGRLRTNLAQILWCAKAYQGFALRSGLLMHGGYPSLEISTAGTGGAILCGGVTKQAYGSFSFRG